MPCSPGQVLARIASTEVMVGTRACKLAVWISAARATHIATTEEYLLLPATDAIRII